MYQLSPGFMANKLRVLMSRDRYAFTPSSDLAKRAYGHIAIAN